MVEEGDPIVIDIGSYNIKAGFAGDDAPKATIPTVIGKPKLTSALVGMEQKENYIGYEVFPKKHILERRYPVERGIIQDFDDIQAILNHLLNFELKQGLED